MSDAIDNKRRLLEALEKQQSGVVDVINDLKKASENKDRKSFTRDIERLKWADRHYRLRLKNRLDALTEKDWLNFEQSAHVRLAIAQSELSKNLIKDISGKLDDTELNESIGQLLYSHFVGPIEFELATLAPLYAEAMLCDTKKK